MVLQCDAKVPVWGTAEAGEEVTVEFAGQKNSVKADASGNWASVNLKPMKILGGKPDTSWCPVPKTAQPVQLEDALLWARCGWRPATRTWIFPCRKK